MLYVTALQRQCPVRTIVIDDVCVVVSDCECECLFVCLLVLLGR